MADAKPGDRRTKKPVKPPTIELKAEEVKGADDPARPPTTAAGGGEAAGNADVKATDVDAKPNKPSSQEPETASAARRPAAGESATANPSSPPDRQKAAVNATSLAGYARYLGAGVGGAVVALAVNFIAAQFGAEPQAPVSLPPEFAARIDALEKHQTDVTGELARVLEKLDQPASAPVDVDAALAPLRSELDGSKATLVQLQKEAADLKGRLEAIAASGVNGAPAEAIAGFEAAIDTLRSDVASLREAQASGAGGQWDETRVKALETSLAKLESETGAMQSLATETSRALTGLKAEVAGISDRLAAAGTAAGGDASGAAATALALADLRDAISRGAPFATELAALRALAGDIAVLSRLDPVADAGVATQRQLAGRFEAVLPAVLAAAHKRDDAGIVAQLVDGVRGIVTIRPVGELAGDSPEAIVARIETGLADGDYAGALAAWEALPAAARDAGGDWGEALSRKAEADAIVSQVGRDILARLKGAS